MAELDRTSLGWLESQKDQLEKERTKLQSGLRSAAAQLETMGTSDPSESGDIAAEDREDYEVAGTLEAIQPRLEDVEDALSRIADGDYGRCSECRGVIPLERLSAMPSAVRCVLCQASHERRVERLRLLEK